MRLLGGLLVSTSECNSNKEILKRYIEGLNLLKEILHDSDFEIDKERLLDNENHFNNKIQKQNVRRKQIKYRTYSP